MSESEKTMVSSRVIDTLRYIQVGEFKKGLFSQPVQFTDLIDFKYKDSTKFESRSMQKSLWSIKLHRVNLRPVYMASLNVYLLHPFDNRTFWIYAWKFKMLYDGMVRTVERTYFGKDRENSPGSRIDFWWDVRNGVMWTDNLDCFEKLLPALEVSFACMDLDNSKQSNTIVDLPSLTGKL